MRKNRMGGIILLMTLFVTHDMLAQQKTNSIQNASELIQANAKALENVDQLILVSTDADKNTVAVFFAYEKINQRWTQKFGPIKAVIGRNGMADPGNKIEGDGKSPTGLFELGQLFSYEKTIQSQLPFIQSGPEDKWIDDPASPDYNRHIRGTTKAKSYENLLLTSIDYKYCMVIEYNTRPVLKGKGSAIFFHLADANYTPTAGCVAIRENDMLTILSWLKPSLKKYILMGSYPNLLNLSKKE